MIRKLIKDNQEMNSYSHLGATAPLPLLPDEISGHSL